MVQMQIHSPSVRRSTHSWIVKVAYISFQLQWGRIILLLMGFENLNFAVPSGSGGAVLVGLGVGNLELDCARGHSPLRDPPGPLQKLRLWTPRKLWSF